MGHLVAQGEDWIAAIATPPGKGGVGIVRLSGRGLLPLLSLLTTRDVTPRTAIYTDFSDNQGQVIDKGLLLYFPAPHSFTGEDVIELHGHGGPVVMDSLLQMVVQLGCRIAQPGEFSQRAFLNDKIDLAQAEAIADLINASTQQAARSAVRSLQGEFSHHIHQMVESLVQLRIYVEAAIDFPDEEIDFLSDNRISDDLSLLIAQLDDILKRSKQGVLLQEGMTVVIAGKPNAGKSSLLNALSGRESAIVTPIAGTTRDVLRENIHIDGMPLHVVDTAGLRDSSDAVEQEGIRRAWQEIDKADRILFIVDATESVEVDIKALWPEYFRRHPEQDNVTLVFNKADRLDNFPQVQDAELPTVVISAKSGFGLDALKEHLKNCMGYQYSEEGSFLARRRHLDILTRALLKLRDAEQQLTLYRAGELVAEDLRDVQNLLGEITGEFSSDDLLGRIFSSFCIGK